MSQLREVNLGNGRSSNNPKIMSHGEVADYEADKQKTLDYLNGIANLLIQHNQQIAPIVDSYKRRNNNG